VWDSSIDDLEKLILSLLLCVEDRVRDIDNLHDSKVIVVWVQKGYLELEIEASGYLWIIHLVDLVYEVFYLWVPN
jgi:hypothetical protein